MPAFVVMVRPNPAPFTCIDMIFLNPEVCVEEFKQCLSQSI